MMEGPRVSEAEIRRRFLAISEKAKKLGITGEDLAQLSSVQNLQATKRNVTIQTVLKGTKCLLIPIFLLWVVIQLLALGVWLYEWPVTRFDVIDSWFYWYEQDTDMEYCVLDLPKTLQDVLRPPVQCDICRNVESVPKVANISREDFEKKYAYSGTPVIITDGASNWNATKNFSFEFFKSIYAADSPVLLNEEDHCQFFPYKTDFQSLSEVFSMSEERAHLQDGTEPWYIGWSNCDSSAANILRQYYDKPYFLPAIAESSRTDWIFMGSPGYGAHMHIDNVGKPSWQAQIRGVKEWTLEPPPECYFECPSQIKLVVEPGQIFVLDTNLWYHSTLILGNEMSITIGTEYD